MTSTPALHLAIALIGAYVVVEFGLERARRAGGAWERLRSALVYGGVTWLLLPVWSLRLALLVGALAVWRVVLDVWSRSGVRPYDRRSPLNELFLDQTLRLAGVAAGVLVVAEVGPGIVWYEPWAALHAALGRSATANAVPIALVLAATYVLGVLGGSVIVRALLDPYVRALPGEDELSLGRVIGYLERLILVTLLLLDQYAAMAVLLGAKSLVRIPSISRPGDPVREGSSLRITTEYFLIGTLGSTAVALFAALVARWTLGLL